ncbi:hypothetical protein FM112_10280 [Gulosibacter sp. 10]|nr:hypothetical protein FM112_10280 [Gulosibacter sp. 10]
MLHESGYHVVMLDHRNHGLSGADRSRQHLAQRYSSDIGTAVEAAHTAWPHSPKLIVWGFSFSTFPTLHSLRHPCTPIHGIICDSGPGLDLETMLQDFLTGGNLPAPPGTRRFLRSRKVADAFAAAAIAMLGTTWPPDSETSAASSVPMLFLVGREDRVVAPEQIRALAARYPRARHAEFPADHLESVKAAPEAYREAVGSFLASLTAPEPHG